MARSSERQPAWHALVNVLMEHRQELIAQIQGRMRRELRVYERLAAESYESHIGLAVESTLRLSRVRTPKLPEEQIRLLEQVGAAEARLGVPVDQMLLAWRLGVELLVQRATEEAQRLGISEQQQLMFVRAALRASDLGMSTTARGHREIELEHDRVVRDLRADFVRAVLFAGTDAGELRERAKSYRLDVTRRYVAVRVRLGATGQWPSAEQAVGLTEAARSGLGMGCLIDGDLAGFLALQPGDAAPARAGVGPAVPLERLCESFRLASRALRTMEAFGLAGTRDLASLGLRPAVLADPDVGIALRDRYLAALTRSASNSELLESLRAYLASGGHVETAAARLHVHPNTLRYRLARFEELAEVKLREPLVACELWWALEYGQIAP